MAYSGHSLSVCFRAPSWLSGRRFRPILTVRRGARIEAGQPLAHLRVGISSFLPLVFWRVPPWLVGALGAATAWAVPAYGRQNVTISPPVTMKAPPANTDSPGLMPNATAFTTCATTKNSVT